MMRPIYTGSNARFLSKDVIMEFRGRGDEVHVHPLSFAEFMSVYSGTKQDCWNEYMLYGGLPPIINLLSPATKAISVIKFSRPMGFQIRKRWNRSSVP